MKVSVSWLRRYVDIPDGTPARDLAAAFIRNGFEVEGVELRGGDVVGPLIVGKVLEIEELAGFKKPIRYCQVDVGVAAGGVRGIVCGARNFAVGDVVVAALPGAVLPGGFEIAARTTYERVSDGMLCSERELGLGDDHSGIIVLAPGDAAVGDDARALLELGDAVLDIAVNPDRGYAMSVRGLARELALALEQPFSDPLDQPIELPTAASADLVGIQASACTRFNVYQLDGVNPHAQTPRWMRNRLSAAGMRPVSLIVDITNYVMLETGQPLHAYDRHHVDGPLIARDAIAGELLETLDHQDRVLSGDDLVIADASRVLGLAGVMGGVNSEITDATTSVVLESAHFDASRVAATCRRHGISTESSRRFERGVDPQITDAAARLAVYLMLDLAGGTLVSRAFLGEAPAPTIIDFNPAAVIARTGLDVEVESLLNVLSRIGCSIADHSPSATRVTIASWRPDLTAACDLSEELARVVGYDQIPSVFPAVFANARLSSGQLLRRRIDDTVASLGWVQVMTTPFMDHDALASWQCEAGDARLSRILLTNPLSDEQPFMRSTLLPGLFAALERNRGRGFESAALYERSAIHRGKVTNIPAPSIEVKPSSEQITALDSALPVERQHLAAVAFGSHTFEGPLGAGRQWMWSDAIDAVLEVCRIAGLSTRTVSAEYAPWHPGRCARIEVDVHGTTEVIGYAGEVHPRVIESLRGPAGLIAFEIDLGIVAQATEVLGWPRVGNSLGTSAVVKEDLALVVAADVPAATVMSALRDGCGPWLEDIRLFDRYAGAQVPTGHVSLAFSLRFRHPERTLRDEEVAVLRQQGINAAAASTGAVLRGGM